MPIPPGRQDRLDLKPSCSKRTRQLQFSPIRSPMSPITLSDIQAAAERLAGHIVRTPLLESPALSAAAGCRLLVKAEVLAAHRRLQDQRGAEQDDVAAAGNTVARRGRVLLGQSRQCARRRRQDVRGRGEDRDAGRRAVDEDRQHASKRRRDRPLRSGAGGSFRHRREALARQRHDQCPALTTMST